MEALLRLNLRFLVLLVAPCLHHQCRSEHTGDLLVAHKVKPQVVVEGIHCTFQFWGILVCLFVPILHGHIADY